MKRSLAFALAVLLTGCGGDAGDSHGPNSEPTLPPGGAFKDGLLYAAIKARLAGSDIDSTTRISVIVRNGDVTLRGAVKNAAVKAHEVQLIREMRGVKAVNDELHVGRLGRSAAESVSDLTLVAAVEASLAAQAGVNVTGIRVAAVAGAVTLAGHAPSAAIKSTLLAAARRTSGVRNVVDRIAVKE